LVETPLLKKIQGRKKKFQKKIYLKKYLSAVAAISTAVVENID